jgi:hypothetical protein
LLTRRVNIGFCSFLSISCSCYPLVRFQVLMWVSIWSGCCWGGPQLGQKFLQENGLKHVQILTADGALEAAPAVSIYLEQ